MARGREVKVLSGGPRASLRWVALLLGASVLGSCVEPAEPPLVVPLQTEPVLSVELTFGERTAWFMFDTGAGAHTLARWFVDAAGMTIDADAPADLSARDVTGQTVQLQVVREPVGRLPDGGELALGSTIVADFPPHFEETETEVEFGSARALALAHPLSTGHELMTAT